jgi:polysaccharide export outer membrane protein
MKKLRITSSGFWMFLVAVLLVLSSCIPMKKVKYLQEKAATASTQTTNSAVGSDYQVRPGDNLYIRIIGLDDRANNYFNVIPASSATTSSAGGDAGTYLQSYTVNPVGKIELPIIGPLVVAGKNLTEVKDIIQKEVDEYLKESTVIVKFVSFNITILGEVKRPGKFPVYQEKINILEVIGMAGDLTTFANRSKIILVRQNADKTMLVNIDVTDRRILQSEYFYLKPNDILYIEPLKGRTWAFEAFPYSLIFSTITTTLLIWNFFK